MQTFVTTVLWGAMGGFIMIAANEGSVTGAAIFFLVGSVAMAMRLENIFLDSRFSDRD